MKRNQSTNSGVLTLVKQYKSVFRIPENIEYYSEDDFEIAERKFLIWCLENRPNFSNSVSKKE